MFEPIGGGPTGVGIVGTGLAFQAIHARTLEGMTDQFTVRAVWDPDAGRAATAAEWLNARAAVDCDDLFADPSVAVVVLASPARFHAEQAIAAIRAGKRAVLVEKPLCATPEEADSIAREAQAYGAVLLVGAMHRHDPAWHAALAVLADTSFAPALVRSTINLPPNARFEEWTTEPLLPVATQGAAWSMDPAHLIRMCLLELAIHDLPLVRRLLPSGTSPHVVSARLRKPFGYAVSVRVGDVLIDLTGMLHGHWQTDWTLEATGREGTLKLDFTPSFVAAGSGTMIWESADTIRGHPPSDPNGYAGEWQAIAAMLDGQQHLPDPFEVAEDFRFAHAIAEQAATLVAREITA